MYSLINEIHRENFIICSTFFNSNNYFLYAPISWFKSYTDDMTKYTDGKVKCMKHYKDVCLQYIEDFYTDFESVQWWFGMLGLCFFLKDFKLVQWWFGILGLCFFLKDFQVSPVFLINSH